MDQAKPKMGIIKKILIGAGIVFIVLVVVAAMGGEEKKQPTANQPQPAGSQTQPAQQPEQPVITITAVQLSEEYYANKVAADAKYEDRIVEVSGIIDDIGKDILDTPYVTLEGRSTSLFGIQCMFSKEFEAQLATLKKEQNIVLRGKVDGELIGNVIVRDCSIVN